MQFTLETKFLSKSLRLISPIVEKKNVMPILSNVKIDAEGDAISLSVTDNDLYVVASVLADIHESGSITVPAHVLFDIVRKLPDNSKLHFMYDVNKSANEVIITSDTMRCSLPVLPSSDFPNFTQTEYDVNFNMEAKDLLSLLTGTKYATSSEEIRYYLNGIYLHTIQKDGSNILRATATDVHRLALRDIALPDGAKNMQSVIIPKKTVNEIIKFLDEDNSPISISVSHNRILFIIDNIRLSSKLIDGTFPNYQKVIPENCDKHLETSVKSLINAIDLVTTISADKTKAVRFNINTSKTTLSANSVMNGFSKASQDIEANYTAEPLEISFNSRYILDALSTISGPMVTLSMNNATGAVMIKESGNDTAIHMLMPMQ